MNRQIRALVLGLGFLFALPALAAEPSGRSSTDGNVEKARASFQQGVDLFHEGNFEAALAEFLKAYATAPSYRILYNIAQAQYEIHDYVSAARYYRQYLTDGGSDIAAARRAQVEETTQKLQARVASVEIQVNVAGADVRVDDVTVGTSPLPGPIAVNPGPRHVSAIQAGVPIATKTITVAGGDRIHLALELSEVTPRKSRLRSSDEAKNSSRRSAADLRSRSRAPLAVSLTATVASGVTAGVFGWLALRAKRDFENDLNTFMVPASTLDSDRSRLRAYALVTDVAVAASLVSAGFSVYFLLSRPNDVAPQMTTRPFVAVAPTWGGLAVHGGW